jgi:hypothetical protein
MSQDHQWREVFEGGSPEAEREIFLALARDMLGIQEANRQKMGAQCPLRTLHAKAVAATGRAELRIDPDLPARFTAGHVQPGAVIPASVRFSNASSIPQSDALPDMRGAAVRLALPDGGMQDLLMTSFPVSHARDARQFVAFALIAAGDRATMPQRLVETFGVEEAKRMGANLAAGIRPCATLASESFWSRGAVLWAGQPVRYALRPVEVALATAQATADLHADMASRLVQGPVTYRLTLQPFIDEARTPIEDGAVEWREEDSPPVEVATLVLHQQDLLDETGLTHAAAIEQLAFNPWNTPDAFRPLGNLNRARGVVYGKSAQAWQASHPD